MSEWSKKLTTEALREVVSQAVWSYWPYGGGPLVSALFAYTSGYNLAVIWAFALFSFAMIALALNNFSQWMRAQTPADKVDFVGVSVGVKNDTADPPRLEGIKLGVALLSRAGFPIEIRMDDLETQIADRVPSKAFKGTCLTVGQGGVAQFGSAMIELSDIERSNKILYGRLKAAVSYGRPGKLKHGKEQQVYLALKFDKDGNFEGVEQSVTEFAGPDTSA
jgi:hypothetical protein